MTICKTRSRRKETGARYKAKLVKKKHSLGNDPRPTSFGKLNKNVKRTRGGSKVNVLVSTQFANLANKGKNLKVKILDVVENAANRHFTRRKILTKGAVIKTEKGNAIVTSRPSHDGSLNAKLLK